MLQISNFLPPRIRLLSRALNEWHRGEPELRILDKLCRQDRVAVDVGANYGIYSWYLRQYASAVIAFEPQPQMADFLQAALAPQVRVEPIALSDRVGFAPMRVPRDRNMDGCATIEEANKLPGQNTEEIAVQTRPLDSYDLGPIGFMKIDVEGHELKVLQGAEATLRRDRPNLLVEAEERHRPGAVSSLVEYLTPFGYRAFYLDDGDLRQLSDSAGRPSPDNAYNFVFTVNDNL